MKYFFYILFLGYVVRGDSKLYEYFRATQESCFFWEIPATEQPFDELILTWNAERPSHNGFSFFVSLKQNGQWSPLLFYGQWGSWGQMLFHDSPEESSASTHRGVVKPKHGKSDGFKIYVESSHPVDSLFVFTNEPAKPSPSVAYSPIYLANPELQSLITLRANRYSDLYLTTAVSIATNTLLQNKKIDLHDFAQHAYDQEYDAYDHWILSAAQSYVALEGKFTAQIQKLADFNILYSYLAQGTPVVVGIQGTITGAPRPYSREHAICVIGYDPITQKVHCIDPYFPTNKSTPVSYSLDDFILAWNKRQNIACTFKRRD